MAAGALSAIEAARTYPNSETWLRGPQVLDAATDGKLYCVPYYAGARAVASTARTCTPQVGVKAPPTSYSQWSSPTATKLMKKFGKNSNFSAFYEPGQNWYVDDDLRRRTTGWRSSPSRRKNGKWQGTSSTRRQAMRR